MHIKTGEMETQPVISSATDTYGVRTLTNGAPWCFVGFVNPFQRDHNLRTKLLLLFQSADCISSVVRVAFREPGLQNERHGAGDLRVGVRLHSGGHRRGQVRRPRSDVAPSQKGSRLLCLLASHR